MKLVYDQFKLVFVGWTEKMEVIRGEEMSDQVVLVKLDTRLDALS